MLMAKVFGAYCGLFVLSGHGKELGDRFLERLGFPVTTNSVDHLVSLLTEGCVDRLLKERD